ncbi:MAG: outer membrane lipoprotein-sorting protein [Treponema sp.]|uniref:outer membrane lipoprotein-sorting protein n=1 Tax=Treponema sp. TaxID=166 RepID=UPI001B5A317A|nr:outer membrane lipoprotein-sorting protein [Treponema sp.]MBP5403432.1 outer membrane lipoprotein-sorting protein [Treponema sp.]MBR5933533.1 outer membrane lipoprotein-sorting protein [Treponema sp.]
MKKTFNNILLTLLLGAGLLSPLSAQVTKGKALELLKQADKNTNYSGTDFKADYTIVTDKPGSGKSVTSAVMYRRDSASMFTIVITGPDSDKGKGYVQFDKNIWFYDPRDRQFTYTSARNRFQNSALNNSDLIPQTIADDYEIKDYKEVKLGKFDCVYYELSAVKKTVDYATVKLWVSIDDGLIRKKEDYSLSGQLLRTTAIPSYQKVDNRFVPSGMLVVDNLRGTKIDGKMQYEKTQITIANVSFQKQSNVVYSKKFLEEMSD